MDPNRAATFARAWADAWNAHDVDAVLAHFADDAVFTSPVAAKMLPETAGILRGKAALRAYWVAALARVPDLRFEVLGAYAGVDHAVIHYRNHLGGLVCEVLRFAGDLVVEGAGTYLAEDAAAASGIHA
jgi:ketosteroid isomerase-like protein